MLNDSSTWSDLIADCELLVAFGGVATKNAAVNSGGPVSHDARIRMRDLAAAGCDIVSVSPLRDDLPDAAAQWVPLRPGTDVALMLGLAHHLVVTDRVDTAFLDRYTVGYPQLRAYILGESDGVPKTPDWASTVCDVPADDIRDLAERMARSRTFVSVAPALQRARFGEQPVWMGVALAALLGGIGLPGQGFSVGHGSMGNYGNQPNLIHNARLPQGRNPHPDFIPVARIADMLLDPGGAYPFDGEQRRYPDIRLVYWAGGNPFHHHQDLFRLHEAFQRPETVIVHDSFWTATARHADLVFPATMTVEREDISGATNEPRIIAMHRLAEPHGLARDDFEIFASIAAHLDLGEAFTEGRTPREWLAAMYDEWAERAHPLTPDVPDFQTFWRDGSSAVPVSTERRSWLSGFRAAPDDAPLQTPSGRIELFSDTVASFGYADCPGHPAWLTEPDDPAYPLTLVANQPATKLHSQLDVGAVSMSSKRSGRETLRLHPADAASLGLDADDFAIVESPRGSVIVAVQVSDAVRPGVVQLPTGAWFDPDFADRTCVSGNPNAVTRDIGSSSLGQGCTGQLTRVRVRRFDGPLPEITCRHAPPGARADEA
jgi:biotin/methionine sulfoxide reductase